MTYLFSDGFDGHGALADRWTRVDAGASIVADGGKYGSGTNSLKFAGSADFNRAVTNTPTPTNPVGTPLNPFHMSFFIKVVATPGTTSNTFMFKSSSDNDGSFIKVNTSGQLGIGDWRSGVSETTATLTLGGFSSSISNGVWHHVEMIYVVDDTSGVAKMWIDGVLEIDFSGDTNASGTITAGGIDQISIRATGANTEFDDLLMWDEEGTSMNTTGQLGIHRIETIIPDGDGNSTQLTPTGTGTTNADRVDEVDADDDTTYVESSTATHKDLYTYSAMAGTPATVEGVVVHTRGSNPDNGAISFKQVTRSNVTEADGATFQLSGAGVYAQHTEFVALDPDGSIAWTKTKIDLAEFGVEVV